MKFSGWFFGLLTMTVIVFSLPAFGMQLCDYDQDDDVDGQDLSEFADYFAVQDPAADLDDSGVVDDQDLSICSQEFGRLRVEDINPIVLVSNLRENTVVKTGVVIGTASDNDKLLIVEVKLDDGNICPLPAPIIGPTGFLPVPTPGEMTAATISGYGPGTSRETTPM